MRAYSQKGSMVVEASLIIPVIIFCILAVLYIAILLYQQACLQSLSDKAAARGIEFWENSAKSIETGWVSKDDLDKAGLYWRLMDTRADIKKETIKSYINSYDNYSKLDSFTLLKSVQSGEERVKVDVADYVVYKKLTVILEDRYKIPLGNLLKGFGLSDGFSVKVKSEVILNEPVEFIRNTDFLIDTERGLENRYPGLKDAGDKTRDIIGDLKKKISDTFK